MDPALHKFPGFVPSRTATPDPTTPRGFIPAWHQAPRELTTAEVRGQVEEYRQAAMRAKRAGFDGVELHGAHGYFVDQFLNDSVNLRTDEYGGSLEGRCRFLFEVVEALCSVFGSDRVGVRLSPSTFENVSGTQAYIQYGQTDSSNGGIYDVAIEGLNRFNLAYLMLTEPRWNIIAERRGQLDESASHPVASCVRYRKLFKNALVATGGFNPKDAEEALESGVCDLIGFGRWFISNPDLPERLRSGKPLNAYNRRTFYTAGNDGYTDYPDLAGRYGVGGKYKLMPQEFIRESIDATEAAMKAAGVEAPGLELQGRQPARQASLKSAPASGNAEPAAAVAERPLHGAKRARLRSRL